MCTIEVEEQASLSAELDPGAHSDAADNIIGVSSPSSSRTSTVTAQTMGESFSASSSTHNESRDADGDVNSTRPTSSGTDMTEKLPGDVGEGLRFLLAEYGLDDAWSTFVSELLKDIIDSQSSFQVSVDRNEVSPVLLLRGRQAVV